MERLLRILKKEAKSSIISIGTKRIVLRVSTKIIEKRLWGPFGSYTFEIEVSV